MGRRIQQFPGESHQAAFAALAAKSRFLEKERVRVWIATIQAGDVFSCGPFQVRYDKPEDPSLPNNPVGVFKSLVKVLE